MNPLTQELKDKWVAALRSGEYTQGFCGLRYGNEYCCLGVLCDVIDPTQWKIPDQNAAIKKYSYDESTCYAPKAVVCLDTQYVLSKLNDSGQYDFNEIANRIENLMVV